MKVYLAYLEWYMKVCKANGQGPGYYDSFKNAGERRDSGVYKYKTILTNYWEHLVNEAEKKPHLLGTRLRSHWLYGGTNYRRIVEPLDIAEHYKRGRKDYIKQGRSKHYILLEKWLKHQEENGRERAGHLNSKLENIESCVTEDLCFWARVEEAIRSCRLLDSRGSLDGSEREKLVKFKEDVVALIKDYAVSPDIFLEKSSYMQWWREYVEILERQMMGDSHNSQLVAFMREERYKNYAEGSPRMFQEGHSNVAASLPVRLVGHRTRPSPGLSWVVGEAGLALSQGRRQGASPGSGEVERPLAGPPERVTALA
ncbi:senescence-associated carboxylesterase 101-like [Eucalyptus grandis]|uniref:senescence-associated carboxylesterase 101-like n=1 Tax=Eucalyptus grandis TaxID=71139 RepID=UPI00192E818B|nr:senescence-associated carboxylesterase 101-like [Eucalyptus grandis]